MKKINITGTDINVFLEKLKNKLLASSIIPEKINETINPSVSLKKEEKVNLIFEEGAFRKTEALVRNCSKEVGWYASVIRESEKRFVVKELSVPPQIVTGATVNTDDDKYVEWHESLSDEFVNTMRFYGHSHVNMAVSPSGTDAAFQKDALANIKDFYIFGIFNKKGEAWFNIYDITNNVIYEDKDINYLYYGVDENTWAKQQLKEKVTELKMQSFKNTRQIFDEWQKYYD